MNNEDTKKSNSHEPLDNSEKEGHDDVVFDENVDEEGEELSARDTIRKLREKLKKCGAEKQEYLLGWQRTKADFVNARKAEEESRKDILKFAHGNLIEELLPVIESFEQAFSNKEAWEKVDKNWRIGVEYIYQKLISTLEQNGLKQLNPIGEQFDPALHISSEMIHTENEKEDHMIVEVIQKGYALNGKILKPPNVKVAVLKEESITDNRNQ